MLTTAQSRGLPAARRHPPDLEAALKQIPPGARIASICTGAFVLAAAGILDGHRATTHWKNSPDFTRLFPKVDLDPDVLFTDSGDVLTSAGVASGIDLCIHIIRSDHGASVANAVARGTVVPPHREGGQAQYIQRPVPEAKSSTISGARDWALQNLDHPLTLDALAKSSAVSKRTFTRKFREETGISPMQWIAGQRTQRARELLETTDLTVDRVAEKAGFGTGATLRLLFRQQLGITPQAYRNTFRGPVLQGTSGRQVTGPDASG